MERNNTKSSKLVLSLLSKIRTDCKQSPHQLALSSKAMKYQRIGLTGLITLTTTLVTPFTPNLTTLLPVHKALSQPAPSSENPSDFCDIQTQSMLPTADIHDYGVINKLSYRSQSPNRGDIVVFRPTKKALDTILSTNLTPNDLVIKRVIGLPGETVRVADGKVYINNKPLEEKYLKEKPNYLFPPATISSQSYFVLGDNRNDSYDSHNWGPVAQQLILGQVVRIVKRQEQPKSSPVKHLCY